MLTSFLTSLLLAINVSFTPPMTHEISLAGNFGEPRPNHFHGGLDMRTEGVEGKRVMSIGDGYVSRLTVGLYGFGNAVYVTHPEGYTSVYCHLRRFSPRLQQRLRQWQAAHPDDETIDIRLSAADYPVAQGQLIAFSGNTGHSFGPHLHLEIHETRSWNMLDPLEFLGAYVNDSVPPLVHSVRAYPQQGRGVFNVADSTAWGDVGFGLWADDYMQNAHNYYGIRLTRLLVDGREVFRADVNDIPHAMNRMINSWGDYDHFLKTRHWYLKSFIEPGNRLPILSADERRGIVRFDEERDYHLEYILTDYFGNETRHPFVVRGRQMDIPPCPPALAPQIRWNQTNLFSRPGMMLVVPAGNVGTDQPLADVAVTPQPDALSARYTFSRRSLPLFFGGELSMAAPADVADPSLLRIVWHNGNSDILLESTCADGWVTAQVKDLGGSFELVYDTTNKTDRK